MKPKMKNNFRIAWICGAAAIILAGIALFFLMDRKDEDKLNLVIGTYGENAYLYSFDTQDVEFKLKAKAEVKNPSYAIAENNIFTVSENGAESGISSFVPYSGMKDGNTYQPVSFRSETGADPCFMAPYEYAGKKFMLTADYNGGSISIFTVENGKLSERFQQLTFKGNGPVSSRQEASHIHQIRVLPKYYDYIVAPDLGADMIHVIKNMPDDDEAFFASVKQIRCPAGSGPRHIDFSPDHKRMYCLTELSGEVLVYDITNINNNPEFIFLQKIQADQVNAGGSADIHVHPSGKWLYTSHRLDNDGIAIFKIMDDGRLEKIGYCRTARHPRNFMITPDGRFLLAACRDDKMVQVFAIEEDGSLTLSPTVLQFDTDMPSSITLAR